MGDESVTMFTNALGLTAKRRKHAPQGGINDDTASFAITVKNLTVAYNVEPVLWNVDLELPAAKLIAIVGPNGAGKSTLIKAIMGLIPVAAGKVSVYGRPYTMQKKLVAYVPQRGTVDWDFPTDALDVVQMGMYGKLGWIRRPTLQTRVRAIECLKTVGLDEYAHRQIGQLSGGQQQRVFLARALAQDAQIYLMDEPLNGVDAVTEKTILSTLEHLLKSNKTVVMVHHDLQTVDAYAEWVVLLNKTVIAAGDTKRVLTKENLSKAYKNG